MTQAYDASNNRQTTRQEDTRVEQSEQKIKKVNPFYKTIHSPPIIDSKRGTNY